jgi:hypothetical protein
MMKMNNRLRRWKGSETLPGLLLSLPPGSFPGGFIPIRMALWKRPVVLPIRCLHQKILDLIR